MTAFTCHKFQQKTYASIAPIYLTSSNELHILTIFRFITLIVYNFGECREDISSSESIGRFKNDKIILKSTIARRDKANFTTPYMAQEINILTRDGKPIFEAKYVTSGETSSSPALFISTNHIDPSFDDYKSGNTSRYCKLAYNLEELWHILLDSNPKVRTHAFDNIADIIPDQFF